MSSAYVREVIHALSEPRMEPFLARCDGNAKRALGLYQWHGKLTAAVQLVLGTTEVIVRNAIDRQLQQWNTRQLPGATSWLLEEPAAPLRSLSADQTQVGTGASHTSGSIEASHASPLPTARAP